jgi:hypothetical protein
MGFPVAEPGPAQDRCPDVIAEPIIMDECAAGNGEDPVRGRATRQCGLSLLKTLQAPEDGREPLAHVHTAGLAALGDADPASAFCTTNDEYPPLEIHVAPRATGYRNLTGESAPELS